MASTHSLPETGAGDRKRPNLVVTDRDIVFNCPQCRGELVVDREGSGLEVPCSHCGQPLIVPAFQPRSATPAVQVGATASAVPGSTVPLVVGEPPAPVPRPLPSEHLPVPTLPARTFDHGSQTSEQLTRRLDELKHQLKENRSQDTEMRGHVNRATMELHRLQLRLKKLQERQGDIQAELESIQTHLGSNSA